MTNTPDKSEMRACPFCGSHDIAVQKRPVSNETTLWWGECRDCEARGSYEYNEDDAESSWNTRASSRPPADQVPDMVERLGETLHDLSDSLRQIGFFSGERKHIARYEAVVSAFENLAALQAVPAAGEVGETRVRDAAAALIADIRRRYPGEELRCEYMRELDAALNASGEE